MMAKVDSEISALLDELNAKAPAVEESLDIGVLRQQFNDFVRFLRNGAAPVEVAEVRDDIVETAHGRVPVRVYEPFRPNSAHDVIVFFHGGGFVAGNLNSADPTARALAAGLSARVVSVDYRLAPEHPFPAAYEDCLAVVNAIKATSLRWLAVAGDSAGANLAASIAAAEPEGIDAQLLIYPCFDPSQTMPSQQELADGYLLTRAAMELYWRAYSNGTAHDDPRLTPVVLADLRGLPPTVLTTAGFDPLRDEGQEYAARLVAAGVTTTYLPLPSLIHGWMDLTDRIPAARQALAVLIEAFASLRDATLLARIM
jgi:acetyl esterase